MARFGLRLAAWALGLALVASCGGGQTGQPDSGGNCGGVSHEASESWGGTTVADAAEAFVGTYEARLQWQQEPLGLEPATPVELNDHATLTLAYAGLAATEKCNGELRIPVTVMLETTMSALSERGDGELVVSSPGEPLSATAVFRSKRVELSVTLVAHSSEIALEGGLSSLASELPGAAATLATD